MTIRKYLCAAILLIIALIKPSEGMAATSDCRQSGTPTVPSTKTVANLQVPQDLPVGAAVPGSRVGISWSWSCAATGITGEQHWVITPVTAWTATPVAGLTNVYEVTSGSAASVSGTGFRFLDLSGNPVPFDSLRYTNAVDMGDAPRGQTSFQWSGYLEIVKIASRVSPGTSTMDFMAAVGGQVYGNVDATNSTWKYNYTISNANLTTCIVTNPTQTVTLPTLSLAAANSPSGWPGTTPFTISLTCSKGAALYMTVTDNNCKTNVGTILNIKSSCATPGTPTPGISLRRAGSTALLSLGPESSAANTTNQFAIGASPDGPLNIGFIASYNNGGGGKFSAGPISAQAIFTLSYQ